MTPPGAAQHRSRLAMALSLTAGFMVVEALAGVLTGSLVLLADAGHMFADTAGLSLALFAIWIAQRPADHRRTYGYYRTEILAALVNSLLLFGVAAYIGYEAWQRIIDAHHVAGWPLLAVATLGFVVNLVSARLLSAGAADNLNMRAAFIEVIGDMLGSAAAVLAGIIVITTGWRYADPIFALGVALFILPRTFNLLRSAVDVLLEGAPSHIRIADVQAAMLAVPGVRSVHDLHVWTVTSGFVALSGHVEVGEAIDRDAILIHLRDALGRRFGIEHITVQIENRRLALELRQPCLPGDVPCYAEDPPATAGVAPPAHR
jgi:cobalt-zinc-cadmium efflux system protein